MENNVIVQADNLMKIYKTKDLEVVALQGLDLEVSQGELMAIIGSSGSGKSTFLNMIGGLDKPSAGKLFVDGKNLFTMTEKELVNYKQRTVGFVWQNNARNLLPYLTAYENIKLPMRFCHEKKKKERALMLLDMVGLPTKKNSRLSSMSGGEQQRIAIAIALANRPKILLADEPTGSVDTKTSDYVLDIFRNLNKEWAIALHIGVGSELHGKRLLSGADHLYIHMRIADNLRSRSLELGPRHSGFHSVAVDADSEDSIGAFRIELYAGEGAVIEILIKKSHHIGREAVDVTDGIDIVGELLRSHFRNHDKLITIAFRRTGNGQRHRLKIDLVYHYIGEHITVDTCEIDGIGVINHETGIVSGGIGDEYAVGRLFSLGESCRRRHDGGCEYHCCFLHFLVFCFIGKES